MELSESVQKGLQSLADPTLFDLKTFSVLIELAFRSLLTGHADRSVLDQPELKPIDQKLLKHCHTAATTCILEGVKQNVDKSTISLCLEDVRFDVERTDVFYITYQVMTTLLWRCPSHINVSWRLEYLIKNGHVHKVNEPSYLISLNVENTNNGGSSGEDLVGKMKDAAKSLEKAVQL
uniref:COMM domain-containing protein 3 n=1 Tax=Salmo trutta TaxID=8032 RepID=A0A674DQZ9_SALTR